ncbi:MAG: hypothetical protein R3C56_07445 [Pirellulaceae bacterium]
MQNMIAQWRRVWQQPELPFLIVELPAFEGRMKGLDFSWLREAQAEACRQTVNAWLAVTFDTTNGLIFIHVKRMRSGGALHCSRVAKFTAKTSSPRGRSLKRQWRSTTKSLSPLTKRWRPPTQQCAALPSRAPTGSTDTQTQRSKDAKQRFPPAGVPSPVSVRYAWGAMPVANLIGVCGLPAAPFRTDDQPPQSHAFEPLPTFYRIEMQTYALETGRGGSVASLIVGGKQFLSNESDGGTSIPSMFGARNLAYSHLIGPRRFSLADSSASLELACDDSAMTWIVTNGGNDPIELHISLAAAVEVEVRGDQTSAELSRDGTKLTIDGIARVDGDRKLVANIPPHDTAQLHWTFSEPK